MGDIIAECGCGKRYTRETWLSLGGVYTQHIEPQPWHDLECRQCECLSHISIEIPCFHTRVELAEIDAAQSRRLTEWTGYHDILKTFGGGA